MVLRSRFVNDRWFEKVAFGKRGEGDALSAAEHLGALADGGLDHRQILGAALLGVDVDRTISLTFVMGAALAAVGGMMFLLYYGSIDFYIGFNAGIKAFTAAVLGGIGSLPGAILGGLFIGLVEALWSGYFTVEFKDVAAYSILALVLIFMPSGLLGRPQVEKV